MCKCSMNIFGQLATTIVCSPVLIDCNIYTGLLLKPSEYSVLVSNIYALFKNAQETWI